MPVIKVEIDQKCNIKVDAEGFVGDNCMKATEFLRKQITVSSENKKPEFYQQKCELNFNLNEE